MNVTIITQWFPPEQAPIGHMLYELATDLCHAGHNTIVITGFPNHPSGIIFKGYQKKWFQEELLNGIKIWRIYLATSSNRSKFNRIITFLSFTLTSCWTVLRRANCDIIFAVLQPLSIGLFLPIIARVKNVRLVFNIQDLHPEVPIELGLVKNLIIKRLLRLIEIHSYRSADKITTICESFKDHIVAKGISHDKIKVIRNWIDLNIVKPSNRINEFRAKIGCKADDFIILYAGTIGLVSGAEVVLDVAYKLAGINNIKFVFVGEGPVLERLKEKNILLGLNNMIFRSFQEKSKLNQVQATADISLVTLLKNKGNYSVPSKVLGYLAAGRPVIASVDKWSETAKVIKKANCGLIVPSEDADALTNAIIYLKRSKELREQLGKNGRSYIEENLKREKIKAEYINLFESLISVRQSNDNNSQCKKV